jgi:hypothetical protein
MASMRQRAESATRRGVTDPNGERWSSFMDIRPRWLPWRWN